MKKRVKLSGEIESLEKNINFAAIYGAGPDKVANLCKITTVQAQEFLRSYWQKLPKVRRWIEEVKKKAYEQKGVSTLYGRWIPLPEIRSYIEPIRWHWERAAVNYIIQGSAAEILKLAMLQCKKSGYLPLLTVHDELLFNSDPKDVEFQKAEIADLMSGVVKLNVPIIAKVEHGKDWSAAKD
jgi:DNA polymerase-1